MSDIAQQLRAAIKYDVINGKPFERGVLRGQIVAAIDELEYLQREKDARVYYQDIVYYVCNKLDAALGNKPLVPPLFSGAGVVCGTSETPKTGVQKAMGGLCDKLERLQRERDDLQAEVALQKQNVQYRDDVIGLSPDGDRHAGLAAEIHRLQAIVDNLPKCWRLKTEDVVDGCVGIRAKKLVQDCPVAPNTMKKLWYIHPSSGTIYERTYNANMNDERSHRRGYHETVWIGVADCFNSEEAAEFAKKGAE